jgi:hypothetical protein
LFSFVLSASDDTFITQVGKEDESKRPRKWMVVKKDWMNPPRRGKAGKGGTKMAWKRLITSVKLEDQIYEITTNRLKFLWLCFGDFSIAALRFLL